MGRAETKIGDRRSDRRDRKSIGCILIKREEGILTKHDASRVRASVVNCQ